MQKLQQVTAALAQARRQKQAQSRSIPESGGGDKKISEGAAE
jgi:hypothetical protein